MKPGASRVFFCPDIGHCGWKEYLISFTRLTICVSVRNFVMVWRKFLGCYAKMLVLKRFIVVRKGQNPKSTENRALYQQSIEIKGVYW